MKKTIIVLSGLLFLYACGGNDTETLPATEVNMWNMDQDSIGNLIGTKFIATEIDSLYPEAVITFINNNNPNIKLEFSKTSGDTLFLLIPNATFLTQQMGSSGPEVYFAETVYNCTEIPGIKFVNFDFKTGDHAEPGTYKREDFKLKP